MEQKRLFAMTSVMLGLLFFLMSCTSDINQKQEAVMGSVIGTVVYEKILNSPGNGWLTYAGNYKATRFSPLAQINSKNISSLVPKWIYGIKGSVDLRTTPLVYDGIMYATNVNEVHALNAVTGERIWFWTINENPRSGINRGVALLNDKLFFVTEDCRLVALEKETGKLIWDKKYADQKKGYYATLAPLALRDKIIVGVSGSDNGIRGFVAAFSPDDGRELWRFWTVPGRGEFGSETWGENFDISRGGAAPWLNGSYDPDSNTIYWPTGNPWPHFDKSSRPGDNLYSNSMLALDADSGKLKWYFQFTPNDAHGWDGVAFAVLVDMNWRGQPRKVLLQANRNGFFYVLDRTTSELLLAKPFVKKNTWANGLNAKGQPIVMLGMESFDAASSNMCPWIRGATNWWSPSYNPRTGLFYVTAFEQCGSEQGKFYLRAIDPQTGDTRWEYPMPGPSMMTAGTMTTASNLVFAGDDGGHLIALDAVSGRKLWQFAMGRPIFASPMTYAVNGKQYVAIAAGSDIFSFALSNN